MTSLIIVCSLWNILPYCTEMARDLKESVCRVAESTLMETDPRWGLLEPDDDDDDVYLDRITQHKPKNYLPYVKYRPARKGISMKKNEPLCHCMD